MKYWNIPIIIGELEMFWETAEVYLLSNIINLLGKRGLLDALAPPVCCFDQLSTSRI